MFSTDKMPVKVEENTNSGMHSKKSLSLPARFESPHLSLPGPDCLMRLLCPIIGIPICGMIGLRDKLSMGNRIAAYLIRDNLPGFATIAPQQALEESLRSRTISLGLQTDVDDLTALVYGSPKIMLLAVDFDENLVDIEGIAVATVLSSQSSSVNCSEFNAGPTP